MARPTHYVPVISRPVVAALFHEAKRHRIPMTKLVDRLLEESLRGTPGVDTSVARLARTGGTLTRQESAIPLIEPTSCGPIFEARSLCEIGLFRDSAVFPKPTTNPNHHHPMAIKLIANYAKRLGLPGYSSHQFRSPARPNSPTSTQVPTRWPASTAAPGFR
jgi:hypothetical protein